MNHLRLIFFAFLFLVGGHLSALADTGGGNPNEIICDDGETADLDAGEDCCGPEGDTVKITDEDDCCDGEVWDSSADDFCCDDEMGLVENLELSDRAESDFEISPNVTKDDILDKVNADEVLDKLNALQSQIQGEVEDLLDDDEEEELEDDWELLPDPVEDFQDWLSNKIAEVVNDAVATINEKIDETETDLEQKLDSLAETIRDKINDDLSQDITVYADYEYNCCSFDPGSPGWGAAQIKDPSPDTLGASITVGFEFEIAAQPAGVGIGNLPVSASGTVDVQGTLETASTPEPLSPGNKPSADTTVEMQVDLDVTTEAEAAAVIEFAFNTITGFNLEIGDGYDVTLDAEKDEDCP